MAKSNPRMARCSSYGPGFYGRPTASGVILQPSTVGVAHKTMRLRPPTQLKFLGLNGWVIAPVIDRGPFVPGREFDITEATIIKMGYSNCQAFGIRTVQWDYA